jgi:hypothetical protein
LHADSLINNAHFSKIDEHGGVLAFGSVNRAAPVQFHLLENWFDVRDLGAVLDREEPPSGM